MRGGKVMCVYVKVGCEEGLVRWPGIGTGDGLIVLADGVVPDSEFLAVV